MPQGKIVHDRPPMLAVGVMIWLGSELMFFSSPLRRLLHHPGQHRRAWPPAGTHLDTLRAGIFTLVLVSSSFTMQRPSTRRNGASADRRKHLDLAAPSSSGSLFVANQFYEWLLLPDPATDPPNAYGSLFYIMSGLHGLHVFIGLVAMVFLLGRMRGTRGRPR